MPEQLDEPMRQLRARAQDFALQLADLHTRHETDADALRSAVIDASRACGFFSMTQPESHGGTAASTLELTIVRETLASSALPGRRWTFGPGPGVLAGAEGMLERTWLAPLLRGEVRSAFGFTEATGAPVTIARRVGDAWRLDGSKSYVTGGAEADFIAVFARMADDDGNPTETSSLFIVDTQSQGLQRTQPFRSMDGSHHVAMTLEDVRVPDWALVGQPGEGMPRALRQIGDVRLLVAAEASGLMQCALAHLEAFLATPGSRGQRPGDREVNRLRFASARIDAYAARSMLYRTARLVDSGENAVNEVIATKVFATEAAGRAIDTALQLEGGAALVEGHLLERLYREIRAFRLMEGASDVLRLNLARGRLELDKGRI